MTENRKTSEEYENLVRALSAQRDLARTRCAELMAELEAAITVRDMATKRSMLAKQQNAVLRNDLKPALELALGALAAEERDATRWRDYEVVRCAYEAQRELLEKVVRARGKISARLRAEVKSSLKFDPDAEPADEA